MKGIIFNAVESAVVENYDEDTWDDIIDKAGVTGAYTALGTYPDGELFAIVGAACAMLGAEADDLLRVLGRHALPILVDQVEDLVDRDGTLFDFLTSVHGIIHVEVRKLAPDARPPEILAIPIGDDKLEITYRSERGIPSLAEGLILGAADLFGEPVELERRPDQIIDDGPAAAVFHLTHAST